MNKVTIEQKAKAYDNLIERLKDFHFQYRFSSFSDDIEENFPELKESEDEKIRKRIIALVNAHGQGMYKDDMLAWLKKQGEQKSVWHNEDEEPQRDSLILLVMQSGTPIVAKIIEPNHIFNHGEKWAYIDDLLEKQGEHARFIEAIQVGDKVTRNEDGVLVNLSQLNRVAKKDEKQGEQKPAEWSEEDEKMRAAVLQLITDSEKENCWNCVYCNDKEIYFSDIISWLKSLRPQSTWKPSKEQLIALRQVISGCSYDIEPLVEIEEQLKKLREE